MTQLYQRLSQSQLHLQQFSSPIPCASCGSRRHSECSTRSSSSKDKKKHSTTRQRTTGPTITRMPIRSSSHPQLVVVRPKPSRKTSGNATSSSSKSQSPSTSAYTSPLASPLPLYIAEEPFEIETNGIIKGVLGAPMPSLAGTGRRRKDSFHDRPSTWPEDDYKYGPASGYAYGYDYPYIAQEHLHLPTPKLPTFVPASPRKTAATPVPAQKSKPTPPPKPPQLRQTSASSSSSPKQHSPPPISAAAIARRRIDKITPSSYTFASDSTKLGEIPQRNWMVPWDYEKAERLNHDAAATGHPAPVKEEAKKKDKGLFRRWKGRRGSVDV